MSGLRSWLQTLRDRRPSVGRKTTARLLFLVLVCVAIAGLAERLAYEQTRASVRSGTAEDIGMLRVDLERALSSDVQRIRGLAAYTRGNPDLDQAEFEEVARYLMSDSSSVVRDIALARDLVISHVYPLAGNEGALGLAYRGNAQQWPMVEKAIRERQITVAGPLDLVQGGIGVIARVPIVLPGQDGAASRLWGIASMVVDFPRLLESVDFERYGDRYDIVLRGRDGRGGEGQVFLGDPAALHAPAVSQSIQLASGSWQIEASPRGGWPTHSSYRWAIAGLVAAVFAAGLALILWNVRFESALVSAAEALEQARQEADAARLAAEQANRAKTLFLSNMSHELRTPLNAIIGFSEIMSRGAFGPIDNPRYRGYVADIHQASQHLFSLIDDILDISKIESGDIEVRESEVALEEAIGFALHLAGPRLAEKRVALRRDNGSDGPATTARLRADGKLVRQILVNILGNAVKFAPPDGEIRIAVERDARGAVTVRVSDDGPGIEPHLVERALEPFVQLKRSSDVAHQGTGLGLPIAKRLMEAHGGCLSIVGNPSGGTTVLLAFPPERTLA